MSSRRLRFGVAASVAAVVSALLLAGCARTDVTFPDPESEPSMCGVVPVGDKAVLGIGFELSGSAPLTITDVSLEDAQGVELQEAFLLRFDGQVLGLVDLPPVGVNWDIRVEAEGEKLSPLGAHNLVVVVERTGDEASATGITMEFTRDGSDRQSTFETAIDLSSTC